MHKQIENLSIEQMREIVEGAPDGSTMYGDNLGDPLYYMFKEKHWWFFSRSLGNWATSSINYGEAEILGTLLDLKDIRTAISEHDSREFKVGDLVVHPKFNNNKIYEIIKIKGDLFTVFYDRNSHSFRSDLRHATPSEIKAGHRLEAERHG